MLIQRVLWNVIVTILPTVVLDTSINLKEMSKQILLKVQFVLLEFTHFFIIKRTPIVQRGVRSTNRRLVQVKLLRIRNSVMNETLGVENKIRKNVVVFNGGTHESFGVCLQKRVL